MAIATVAGIAIQLIGSGLSAYGKYKQSKTAEGNAQYNAAIALQNAKLIQQSAKLELARGRKDKLKFLDLQRVKFLKSGVRSEGTPFDLMAETASEIELDLQVDYFNSQVAAQRELLQAGIDEKSARDISQQGKLQLAGSAVSLASRVFSSGLTKTKNVNDPSKIITSEGEGVRV